jgi:beta-galactosidase
MWAGFDYRGEPAPLEWPCISTHYGVMDTCGFPKDAFYIHKAQWTEAPMLHIFPHWNWPGREGEDIRVVCVTNCDAVELVLNGKSRGREDVPAYDFPEWLVPYTPGTLEGTAFRDGRPVARCTVATTGRPVAIELEPAQTHLCADGQDAMPVKVRAVDAEGRTVPTADHRIEFTLEGPARMLGVGNGDPACHEPDKANARSLFNGLCQAIIQAGTQPGRITLTAAGPNLRASTLMLETR